MTEFNVFSFGIGLLLLGFIILNVYGKVGQGATGLNQFTVFVIITSIAEILTVTTDITIISKVSPKKYATVSFLYLTPQFWKNKLLL